MTTDQQPQPPKAFGAEWLALMSILSEEDLLRFRKRAQMKLKAGPLQSKLLEALTDELLLRELVEINLYKK
jgi:hypothetical protein